MRIAHSLIIHLSFAINRYSRTSARPLWEYGIRKEIEKGNTVLVVAHTNTLRGLMKVIDSEFHFQ